jgi:hypothetical protein
MKPQMAAESRRNYELRTATARQEAFFFTAEDAEAAEDCR